MSKKFGVLGKVQANSSAKDYLLSSGKQTASQRESSLDTLLTITAEDETNAQKASDIKQDKEPAPPFSLKFRCTNGVYSHIDQHQRLKAMAKNEAELALVKSIWKEKEALKKAKMFQWPPEKPGLCCCLPGVFFSWGKYPTLIPQPKSATAEPTATPTMGYSQVYPEQAVSGSEPAEAETEGTREHKKKRKKTRKDKDKEIEDKSEDEEERKGKSISRRPSRSSLKRTKSKHHKRVSIAVEDEDNNKEDLGMPLGATSDSSGELLKSKEKYRDRLEVSNLPANAKVSDLEPLFPGSKEIKIKKGSKNKKDAFGGLPVATVKYEDKETCKRALANAKNINLDGRPLVVAPKLKL